MKPVKNEFPAGWDEARVRDVLEYYENQREEDAAAEHEAALSSLAKPLWLTLRV